MIGLFCKKSPTKERPIILCDRPSNRVFVEMATNTIFLCYIFYVPICTQLTDLFLVDVHMSNSLLFCFGLCMG